MINSLLFIIYKLTKHVLTEQLLNITLF